MAENIIRERKTPEEHKAINRIAVKRWRLNNPERHAASHRKHNLERYHRLKAEGRCTLCKGMPVLNRIYCQPCADKVRQGSEKAKRRNVANGICPNCGKNPVLPAMKGKNWSFCEHCYFKKTSTDCLKTAKHAEFIGKKLKQQNYRCAYTGEEIILGLNDSLDHVLPISKFPELRSDPNNTEWVTRKVNCMKWDSTRDEFIATAYAVVKHYES